MSTPPLSSPSAAPGDGLSAVHNSGVPPITSGTGPSVTAPTPPRTGDGTPLSELSPVEDLRKAVSQRKWNRLKAAALFTAAILTGVFTGWTGGGAVAAAVLFTSSAAYWKAGRSANNEVNKLKGMLGIEEGMSASRFLEIYDKRGLQAAKRAANAYATINKGLPTTIIKPPDPLAPNPLAPDPLAPAPLTGDPDAQKAQIVAWLTTNAAQLAERAMSEAAPPWTGRSRETAGPHETAILKIVFPREDGTTIVAEIKLKFLYENRGAREEIIDLLQNKANLIAGLLVTKGNTSFNYDGLIRQS